MKYSDQDIELRKVLFSRALANAEIGIRFQPVVNAICQKVVGFEALARWETCALGPVAPPNLLVMAELCDLVDEFSAHILLSACRAATEWQSPDQPIRLSINISKSQLLSECIVSIVERVLTRTGFPAELLDLEIPGHAPHADRGSLARQLQSLTDVGVCLVMDAFEGEESSIRALKSAPFEGVKFDQSVIADLESDHADRGALSDLIDLCGSMNVDIVAVGVETPAQEEALMDLGCYHVQGYLHAKPICRADIGPFLQLRNCVATRRQRCA